MTAPTKKTYDPEKVRDVSEAVYRIRLNQDHHTNVERMLKKDGDGGIKLRNRAGQYDVLTRAYFNVLGIEP